MLYVKQYNEHVLTHHFSPSHICSEKMLSSRGKFEDNLSTTFLQEGKRCRSAVIHRKYAKLPKLIVNHIKGIEDNDKHFRHSMKTSFKLLDLPEVFRDVLVVYT